MALKQEFRATPSEARARKHVRDNEATLDDVRELVASAYDSWRFADDNECVQPGFGLAVLALQGLVQVVERLDREHGRGGESA